MSDQNAPIPAEQGNIYAPPSARVDDVVPEGELVLAERVTRLGAAIIDGVIVGAFNYGLGMILGYNMFSPDPARAMTMAAVIGLGGMVFYLAINASFLARNGQSLGKKALGIKIVRADGSKATLGRIIGMRLAPMWVSALIPFVNMIVGLVDSLLIFRETRKCLHDNIADTIVIKI